MAEETRGAMEAGERGPRILFAGTGPVALDVIRWLRDRGENVVALLLHPPDQRRCGDEIISAAGVPEEHRFDGPRLRDPDVIEAIAATSPDIGVSVMYGYIIGAPLLRLPPRGFVNVHPSLLPYNRGAYPNVWSIFERTPSGVSIHYMDEGVDTGDLIAQRRVDVEPVDTGFTLYRRLEAEAASLFKEQWPAIREGCAPRTPQPDGGTTHRVKDVERVDEVDLDRSYTARELIDLLRARTYPPYNGAYFRADGRKVFMELTLRYEET